MTLPATPGEALAQAVMHWPGACREWNARLIRANASRFGRLNQDCKRALWSAMKAKGGV